MSVVTKKQIRNLISKNRLNLLFDVFSEIGERSDCQAHNTEMTGFEAKYNTWKEDIRTGVIRNEEKNVVKNQIIHGLIELVDGLPDTDFEVSEPLYLKIIQKDRPKFLLYILLILLLICAISTWFYICNCLPKNHIPDPPPPLPERDTSALKTTDTLVKKVITIDSIKTIQSLC